MQTQTTALTNPAQLPCTREAVLEGIYACTGNDEDPTVEDYNDYLRTIRDTFFAHKINERHRRFLTWARLDGVALATPETKAEQRILMRCVTVLNKAQLQLLKEQVMAFFADEPRLKTRYPEGFELKDAPNTPMPYRKPLKVVPARERTPEEIRAEQARVEIQQFSRGAEALREQMRLQNGGLPLASHGHRPEIDREEMIRNYYREDEMEITHETASGITDADVNNLRGAVAALNQEVREIVTMKDGLRGLLDSPRVVEPAGERVPNLLQRICRVYHDLGNVQPTGKHPSGFLYHKPDVLAAKLREMFASYGIFFEAQITNCELAYEDRKTNNGPKNIEMCRLEITFSLVNADNPDDVRVYPWQATGESYDRRAFQVALGSAKKNFLLTQFLIGSDVDDEPRGGNNNRQPQNERGNWTSQAKTATTATTKTPPPERPDDTDQRAEAAKPTAPKSPELPESEERTQASNLAASLKKIGGKPACPPMEELKKYTPDDWLKLGAAYQDAIVAQAGDLYQSLEKPTKADEEHYSNLDGYPIEQVVTIAEGWFKRQPKA